MDAKSVVIPIEEVAGQDSHTSGKYPSIGGYIHVHVNAVHTCKFTNQVPFRKLVIGTTLMILAVSKGWCATT